jgi:hypothetical protein
MLAGSTQQHENGTVLAHSLHRFDLHWKPRRRLVEDNHHSAAEESIRTATEIHGRFHGQAALAALAAAKADFTLGPWRQPGG